jgi:hypoxanthine phosphoribosyltransferase
MIQIHDKTFVPFISREEIAARLTLLAESISRDYKEKCPLFIIVLNGSFMFASDLLKCINIPCEITFIRVASYSQTQSTGSIREIIGLHEDISGRDVIILEDIVDTGLTMHQLISQISAKNPLSIEVATLLHKPEALCKPLYMKYIGFNIQNQFVVGYGLDYDGQGRNLDAIYVVEE